MGCDLFHQEISKNCIFKQQYITIKYSIKKEKREEKKTKEK